MDVKFATTTASVKARGVFDAGYSRAVQEHDEMTKEEFRAALAESTTWQDQCRAEVARHMRAELYRAFAAEHVELVHSKDLAHVRKKLFGSDVPPELGADSESGPVITDPQIYKKSTRRPEARRNFQEGLKKHGHG